MKDRIANALLVLSVLSAGAVGAYAAIAQRHPDRFRMVFPA